MGDDEHAHSDVSEYEVPPIPLLFHEQAFVVRIGDAPAPDAAAAPPLCVDAGAVFEPLESFFGALRVDDALGEFLDDDMALCLAAPSLDLSVYEDDVYARHVSLHDILSLHIGLGRESEFSVAVSQVPRFITRYNALAMELNDAEAEDDGEAEDDAEGEAEVDGDVEVVDETQYEDAEGGYDEAKAEAGKAEADEQIEAGREAEDEAETGAEAGAGTGASAGAEAEAEAAGLVVDDKSAEAEYDADAGGAPDEAAVDDEQAEAKADSGYDAADENAEQEAAYGADEAGARAPTMPSPLHDDYYDEREEGFDVDISSDEAGDVAEYEDEPGSKRAALEPAADAKRTRTE